MHMYACRETETSSVFVNRIKHVHEDNNYYYSIIYSRLGGGGVIEIIKFTKIESKRKL